jgi:carnosine N-methyltransferase
MDVRARPLVCSECGRAYPRLGEIPVLLPEADVYLATCRSQLDALGGQVAETAARIRSESEALDALPATRARLSATARALEGQLDDVRALLDPLLPPARFPRSGQPLQVPATLDYLHYLYRDWGWPSDPDGENERALALVESVLEGEPLRRMLVPGAGGCRLAYDLHARHADETIALDVDPLLLAAAHTVLGDGTVHVREANLEAGEAAQSCREWVLAAPAGALPADRFHVLVADGVEPPFAPASFDTVLTPWFLDQGPRDVRDFIGTIHRLLVPGGRWINVGPLLYAPEVPVGRRFGREELFDLVARAGFRVGRWQATSTPYLVSKLNGRGKVEWVLAFSATKAGTSEDSRASADGPPAWLLFPHLPVPTFPGQSLLAPVPRGAELVLSAIDGSRTVDDIARGIARRAGDATVPLSQIREAVRQCLADVHPECRRRRP